jgi:hypothetical protein
MRALASFKSLMPQEEEMLANMEKSWRLNVQREVQVFDSRLLTNPGGNESLISLVTKIDKSLTSRNNFKFYFAG